MANSAVGTINRLYVDNGTCYIRLDYNQNTIDELVPVPSNGYFQLAMTYPNYNALYSLVLAAAINQKQIWIRAQGDILDGQPASVGYIVWDF